jgi:hypothetical protein
VPGVLGVIAPFFESMSWFRLMRGLRGGLELIGGALDPAWSGVELAAWPHALIARRRPSGATATQRVRMAIVVLLKMPGTIVCTSGCSDIQSSQAYKSVGLVVKTCPRSRTGNPIPRVQRCFGGGPNIGCQSSCARLIR